jgi:hypothetical protein
VTAWKQGYFIGGVAADTRPLTIVLTPLPTEDNEAYRWIDPTPNPAERHNCGNCHAEIYREWSAGAHAHSASNRRFLNLYEGTDWNGRLNVGWNLLAEYPDGSGVCAACHAPIHIHEVPKGVHPPEPLRPALEGIHCDYCHKIAAVDNDQIGLTFGRFGLKLLRPAKGQLFFGPLDDVDRGEDVFAPVYRESRYCASCHEGTVFGVPVYTTYSEWLASPARKEGKQCQTCHMTPTGKLTNLAPGKGGIRRDPATLANHRFFDGSQMDMLRRCLKVNARSTAGPQGIHLEVDVRADQVGHRVPTGFADRNLLLVVEGFRRNGTHVPPESGTPVLPRLAGKAFAGSAGKLYAKQLSDFDGHKPVPFWRAQPDVVDNRLVPGRADRFTCRFPAGVDHVRVRLLHRRFWPEVRETKHWPDDEIVVVDRTIPLNTAPQ